MAIHVLTDGQPIDHLCRVHYGDESGFVERVLDANPGLADLGPRPPAGVRILLPDVEARPESSVEVVTLY